MTSPSAVEKRFAGMTSKKPIDQTFPKSITVNMVDASVPRISRSPFGSIPVIKNHLFWVHAGVEVDFAIRTANALAESIEALANEAVQGEMSAEVAYLVAFAADAIQALLSSVEGAHLHREVRS